MSKDISASLLAEFSSFIKQSTSQTGKIIARYFRQDYQVLTKQDESPVTIADKQAEECLRELITQRYPEHGILGEEYGHVRADADFQWILDPVDGTKSFIAGSFDFGTIIGLTYKGEPIVGAIHQPILNELFIGDNISATFNDKLIHVRDVAFNEAVLVTSDLLNIGQYKSVAGFNKLCQSVKLCRTWGNCFGYSLVAQGYVDIMIDPKPELWDKIGIIPIIRGAGGVITDYHGNNPVLGNSIVAASPAIHAQVIAMLNDANI